jgi:hypothetical protein
MTHMPKNEDVTPAHVCPGMRIQVIDIVQPPGIGIPPRRRHGLRPEDCDRCADNEEQHHDSDERGPGIAFRQEVRPLGDPGLEGGKSRGP